MTTGHKPNLKQDTINTAKLLLAIAKAEGIDLNRLHLFIQSENSDHIELMYYLSTMIPLNQLTGMIQYKEKSQQGNPSTALAIYPILMAADILLYNPDLIPVGKDQTEHLELTRKLAKKLNLKQPQSLASDSIKIMSLTDGTKKMSKSDPSDKSRINLIDNSDTIARKINKAKSGFSLEENTPEINNLLTIYGLLSKNNLNKTLLISTFKKQLKRAILEEILPIQEQFALISDQELKESLQHGLAIAKEKSNNTLGLIKKQ
jgi:tryptophanyl-tRNA synthetase